MHILHACYASKEMVTEMIVMEYHKAWMWAWNPLYGINVHAVIAIGTKVANAVSSAIRVWVLGTSRPSMEKSKTWLTDIFNHSAAY